MAVVDSALGTRIDEIAEDVFRISTPIANPVTNGFTFNQFLIRDERPLLFHMGPRRLFPGTRRAIESVLPTRSLAWLAFSHWEQDEMGALDELLTLAPEARPVCSVVAGFTSIEDAVDRPPHTMTDGDTLSLGRRTVRWIDAPHVPHGWDCGFLFEESTRTLFCGDLFTQGGSAHPPFVETDLVGPSEEMRKTLDYFAHAPHTRVTIERMAALRPEVLACMHGTSFRGDGPAQLRLLIDVLGA